jgi:hypothetical protein
MSPRRLVATALVAAALATTAPACSSKSDDPFTADIKMICNAGRARDDLPPDMRAVTAAREIAEKIKTPEAARLMAAVMQAAPSDKAALMADALAKAGLSRCALLDN